MTTKPVGRWMKPKEVAAYLGENETRVYDWMRDGTLPAWQEGGRWRTKRQWVERFAEQRESIGLSNQKYEQQRRSWGRTG